MPDASAILNNPAIQWGFAFLCLVQLLVFSWFVWLVLRKLTDIVRGNTAALQRLCDKIGEGDTILAKLRDLLLSRPCMARRRPDEGNNENRAAPVFREPPPDAEPVE